MSGYNDSASFTVKCGFCKTEFLGHEEHKCKKGWITMSLKDHDTINHPKHYTQHPSGIEYIQITEHMNFNLGNALKYIWRADLKNGLEDLKKAAWYVQREIELRSK